LETPGGFRPGSKFITKKGLIGMTYLDLVFSYQSQPGENELRAIDGIREVYGIRSVRFNEKERTVRVEFDASRMKQDAVAKLLRSAGIDIKENLALA
jgi:copper chaperone CopZ